MDANAIRIVVRVRPFHPEREEPFLARPVNQHFFLGDGAFASSPRKPVSAGSIRQVIDVCDSRMLDFDRPETGTEVKRGAVGGRRYKNRQYIFDSVLKMEAGQEEVFEKTALPLIDGVLNGFNATVFAYGATGCGKTHTISGSAADPGIIIRTTGELFQRIEDSKDEYDTNIELSMVEIYNETIRDLLAPADTVPPVGGLRLQENDKERVRVGGVKLLNPKTVEEVMEFVTAGNARRSTSSTAMNAVSSRSHAVLQINISRNSKTHDVDMAEAAVRHCTTSATLSIIDLAGSERAAATTNMGDRMREGANINKSLLALSSCIAALCERPINGRRAHVPYRDSKLTRMLKFSLGGNCRTVMVVCVSPSSRDIEDTNNTLVWANKAKNVSTKVTRNTQGVDIRVQQYLEAIQKLTMEVTALKKEIAEMKNGDKVWTDNRRLKDREDCLKAVRDVADMIGGAMPLLTDGAGKRAGWDGAEAVVLALKAQMEKAEGEKAEMEMAMFSSLIRQQDMRFKSDVPTINAIQNETNQKSTIDSVLSNLEQRNFGSSTHPADLDNVRTHVQLKRAEIDRAVLSAREQVYRQAARDQAGALASTASALHGVSTGLSEQARLLLQVASRHVGSEELEAIAQELEVMEHTSKSTLSSLFTSAAGGKLPPLPAANDLASPISTSNPSTLHSTIGNTSLSARPPLSKPTRGRQSLQPRSNAETSFSKRSTVLASPAGKRLAGGLKSKLPPGSPGRKAHHVNTPGKRKFRQSLVPVAIAGGSGSTAKPKAKAGIRWKDTAGEGSLEHHKIMTSDSSSSNLFASGEDEGDDSGEWEEQDKVPPLPLGLGKSGKGDTKATNTIIIGKRALPDPVRPIIAPPRSSIPVPKASPTSQAASASGSSFSGLPRKPPSPSPLQTSMTAGNIGTSSTATTGASGTGEYWKSASSFRSKLSNLRTLDEEGSSISGSSPEPGPSKIPLGQGLGLGPPARSRPPLNDRSDVPGANNNTSLATSFPPGGGGGGTGIYRPTMSSLGKVGNGLPTSIAVSGTTGPRPSISGLPSASGGGRRESSIGPQRNARSRARTSTAPGMGGNVVNAGGISEMGETSTINALSGGAVRLLAPTASSLSRRASTLNLGSAGLASVSETGSLRGPRPSMSMAQLRPGGGRPSVQGLFKAGGQTGGVMSGPR